MPKPDEKCSNCDAYRLVDGNRHLCKLMPPVARLASGIKDKVTTADEWCRQYNRAN